MILKDKILDLWHDLLEHGESADIEAKKAKDSIGDSVMQTICAFANTAGGYLLLGVAEPDNDHDEYWLAGVENQDNILNQIQTNCRNQFTSAIMVDMGMTTIEDKTIIAINVEELPSENKPCGFIAKGKNGKNYTKTGVWLRGLNNDYEATVQDLKPLMLSQAGISYEQVILEGVTLADIDPKHINRYRKLRSTVKPTATELDYDDIELLLALDLASEKNGQVYPNIAGLLLFGSDKALRKYMPMARVDYIRHAGTVWAEDADQRFLYTNDLREAIISMIPRLESNVIDDLPKHFNLPPNALQRADTPLLPQTVVREAIVNMLMHRDYSVNQPSQINRFSDRIEFTNAGYSLKPVEKILEGEKGSQLRNPIIAQVLYDLTFAETKGSGITNMNRGLQNAGLSPVIFKSERKYNESETVLRLQKLIAEDEMRWLKQFEGISDKEAEVLILAKKMAEITNKDVRENVGIDMHQASTILRKFCKKAYLCQHGKSQNTFYTLDDKYLTRINDPSTGISEPSTGISEPSTGISEPSMGGIEPSIGGIAPNTGHKELSTGHKGIITGHKDPSTGISDKMTAISPEMTAVSDTSIGGIEPSIGGIEPSIGGIEPSIGGVEEVITDLSAIDKANVQLLLDKSLLARQKRKLTNTAMKIILLNLMDNHTITPKVLADLLDRNAEFLRKNYLNPMVKEGLIQLFYPNNIKHPNQAYRTTPKGTAWLNTQTDKKTN